MVLWRDGPESADHRHHVEWTVDEDILWGRNTQAAALAEPGLWQERDHVVLRGRLALHDDDVATLEVCGAHVMFDVAAPLPEGSDGAWVEIRVETDSVALCSFEI
ncbi:hypothetical protein [Streptomyces sp. ISL-11]|uniref:hypothetical protein n=1 Tax=Streptomyces sp. ISL-11 TaxID=2819174 RepID=UPI001BE4E744|nr:hypothetical protein [Streptomyces sp. ISL-11]MBT2386545.1 hypothetical protein [Streptomyces sp. ISL-11]